jgi:hypothetical protein
VAFWFNRRWRTAERPAQIAFKGTGALVNSSHGDGVPYLLTANHPFLFHRSALSCGTTARLGVYESFEAFWDYDRDLSRDLHSLPRSRGATLLAADEANDFALLRLHELPAGGRGRTFLGWRAEPVEDIELHRVSHPYSRPQTYSRHRRLQSGETSDAFDVVGSRCCACRPLELFLHSTILEGELGPGSSGAPLVTADLEIAGQLWGICERGGTPFAIDGRFTHTYPQAREWLDPLGYGQARCLCL